MHRIRIALAAACGLLATAAAVTPALPHAFLDHAAPGVGATVSAAPGELALTFTQQVVVALSRVTLARSGGVAIAVTKPAGDGGSSSDTLHVRMPHGLTAGGYIVTWRVVSVDTHPTSGSYTFTVAP